MSRVLVTGGAGTLGAAVVRRLLGDPDFEVRVSDQRPAPGWMREGCEVRGGDLRVLDEARKAIRGCSHVIHLAGLIEAGPHTLTEVNNALLNAVFRAALDEAVERFAYVSSGAVYERAETFPTTEDADCLPPRSAYGFSKLIGERYCRAAHEEHGLPFTILRPFDAYGDGLPVALDGAPEDTRTPTHVSDIADGIVTAMASPAGAGEVFNLAAEEELTLAEIAHLTGRDLQARAGHAAARRFPSIEKARELLGWRARIGFRLDAVR